MDYEPTAVDLSATGTEKPFNKKDSIRVKGLEPLKFKKLADFKSVVFTKFHHTLLFKIVPRIELR